MPISEIAIILQILFDAGALILLGVCLHDLVLQQRAIMAMYVKIGGFTDQLLALCNEARRERTNHE